MSSSYSVLKNSIGAVTFAGELVNKGNIPAERIQIAISLIDAQGNILASSSYNSVGLSVAPAGGKYPFGIYFSSTDVPKEWKDVKIQIQAQPFTGGFIFKPYLELKAEKVTGKAATSSFGAFSLSGQVTNTGQQTATSVHIVGVAYDDSGKVIDVGDSFAKLDEIAPSGNAPFQLEFGAIKTAPPKFDVFVQGREK